MRQWVLNVARLSFKELRSLLGDLPLVALILFAFTIAVYTTAKGVKAEVSHASVGWIDSDQSALSARLRDAIRPPYFEPPQDLSHQEADQALDRGEVIFVIDVPPRFEADVLAGPLLARLAKEAGIIYSMASGDQPALIAELVDWARTIGMEVVCAGKGTKYLPIYHASTPETVWGHYGFSEAQVAGGDFNAQMFNSFLDGTKSALEMAAVANGTGLDCPDDGLAFLPSGLHDLANVFKPAADGGRLARSGLIDIAASQEPDGREVFNNIRYGMFVTFKAPDEYTRACFKQYGLLTDKSGWYASMWRPFHLIGLETSVSVLSAVLRGEATGSSREFRADAE